MLEAAVIGVPDDRWDERPMACVVLKPGASATAGELQGVAHGTHREVLGSREVDLHRVEVPKTSVGKFDKKVLRAENADGALEVQRPD